MEGQRFGRWTVLSFHSKVGTQKKWLCRCDCGIEKIVYGNNLRAGYTVSCGCYRDEKTSAAKTTHGMSEHPAYESWSGMFTRCRNSSSKKFKNYGARGIVVCGRWSSFEKFWADMGPSWFPGGSIERVNVNGNYEPSNCTWIPVKEQSRNTRNNITITTPWGLMILADVARKTGVSYETIRKRYHAGWSPEQIVGVGDFRRHSRLR